MPCHFVGVYMISIVYTFYLRRFTLPFSSSFMYIGILLLHSLLTISLDIYCSVIHLYFDDVILFTFFIYHSLSSLLSIYIYDGRHFPIYIYHSLLSVPLYIDFNNRNIPTELPFVRWLKHFTVRWDDCAATVGADLGICAVYHVYGPVSFPNFVAYCAAQQLVFIYPSFWLVFHFYFLFHSYPYI